MSPNYLRANPLHWLGMLRRLFIIVLFGLATVAQVATAPAAGEPESVLAGIDIRHMRIADVQKLYGEQQAMYAVTASPYRAGTKLYQWGRLTVTLKVLTEPTIKDGEVIRAIEIGGEGEPGDKAINKTGRGLKLGARGGEVKKIYGIGPIDGQRKIQWGDGTTLVITLNEKERVRKLELRAP